MGVHKGHNNNYNLGSLIRKPIEEFIKKNYFENINSIEDLDNDSNDSYSIINNSIKNDKILNNNLINNNNDEIIIQYKINNSIFNNIFGSDIKIFGQTFVDNNKEKCKIITDEKEEELKSIIKSKDIIRKDNNILNIKLKGINNITDISFMFEGCNSLLYIFGIKNWNTSKVNNMSHMFADCKENKYLPEEISFLNTGNVRNLNGIFSNCENLESLPDISKWKTGKVEDMGDIFYNCSKLKSLPDISKWNTCNAKYMENMFYKCESLLSLPDILKWNPKKLKNKSDMFFLCLSLKNKPNTSKWNNNYTISIEEKIERKRKEDEEYFYHALLEDAM